VQTPEHVAIDTAFLSQAELRAGLRENLRAFRIDAKRVTVRVQMAFEAFVRSGAATKSSAAVSGTLAPTYR